MTNLQELDLKDYNGFKLIINTKNTKYIFTRKKISDDIWVVVTEPKGQHIEKLEEVIIVGCGIPDITVLYENKLKHGMRMEINRINRPVKRATLLTSSIQEIVIT